MFLPLAGLKILWSALLYPEAGSSLKSVEVKEDLHIEKIPRWNRQAKKDPRTPFWWEETKGCIFSPVDSVALFF